MNLISLARLHYLRHRADYLLWRAKHHPRRHDHEATCMLLRDLNGSIQNFDPIDLPDQGRRVMTYPSHYDAETDNMPESLDSAALDAGYYASQDTPAPGSRIRLVRHTDIYTTLRPGQTGTVVSVDATGTIHVRWDDGRVLGLVPEAGDCWEEIA